MIWIEVIRELIPLYREIRQLIEDESRESGRRVSRERAREIAAGKARAASSAATDRREQK